MVEEKKTREQMIEDIQKKDTWYKDLNWKNICVWDVFSIVNWNFKQSYTLREIEWKGFWCMVMRKDQWDKFVPLEKFIKKHWVTILYTEEEHKEIVRKSRIKNIQHKIREEKGKIHKSQIELFRLREILKETQ